MITQEMIDRINELYHKSQGQRRKPWDVLGQKIKTEGLGWLQKLFWRARKRF